MRVLLELPIIKVGSKEAIRLAESKDFEALGETIHNHDLKANEIFVMAMLADSVQLLLLDAPAQPEISVAGRKLSLLRVDRFPAFKLPPIKIHWYCKNEKDAGQFYPDILAAFSNSQERLSPPKLERYETRYFEGQDMETVKSILVYAGGLNIQNARSTLKTSYGQPILTFAAHETNICALVSKAEAQDPRISIHRRYANYKSKKVCV